MLRFEKCNGRNAIFGWDGEESNLEIALEAIKTLNLEPGRSYYIGSGRCFFYSQRSTVNRQQLLSSVQLDQETFIVEL